MDVTVIAQLIGSVGFPIVAAGGLFWYMVVENRETRKVVDNNTTALIKVLEHVKKEDES